MVFFLVFSLSDEFAIFSLSAQNKKKIEMKLEISTEK
jgi:hypothetical protein